MSDPTSPLRSGAAGVVLPPQPARTPMVTIREVYTHQPLRQSDPPAIVASFNKANAQRAAEPIRQALKMVRR
jgi:hypothetical protein